MSFSTHMAKITFKEKQRKSVTKAEQKMKIWIKYITTKSVLCLFVLMRGRSKATLLVLFIHPHNRPDKATLLIPQSPLQPNTSQTPECIYHSKQQIILETVPDLCPTKVISSAQQYEPNAYLSLQQRTTYCSRNGSLSR